MGESVVYASIVAAVFASLSALDTRLVLFDTSIADVSDQLSDPVEVIFGVQLGGGTDRTRRRCLPVPASWSGRSSCGGSATW